MNIEQLKSAWNAQADQQNQWDELGIDEIVNFAQTQALETAANRFDGTLAFNWVAADGYANGFDIASELRCMSEEMK